MNIGNALSGIHISGGGLGIPFIPQITVEDVPDVTKPLREGVDQAKTGLADELAQVGAGVTNFLTGKLAAKGKAPVVVPLTTSTAWKLVAGLVAAVVVIWLVVTLLRKRG